MSDLRVVSYNVRRLRGDVEALRDVLRECRPDVVALQEPPRGPLGRGRLRRLAGSVGLTVVVAGGGARTTALLARPRLSVLGPRGMRLPWRFPRTRRGLAMAEVAGIRVVSVHLPLSAKERRRHLVRLLPVIRAASPCVVAGDLNEEPDGPTWRGLRRHLRDLTATSGPTFPAWAPRHRIDAVLGTNDVVGTPLAAAGPAAAASDHLPVVVQVRRR